ncbi:MAG: Hsp33 family molecular chaperone HslO [Metamycoplasmataceae bacterium]
MKESYTKIILKNNVRIYISDYQKVSEDIINIHKYNPLPSLILTNAVATFGPLGFLYDVEKVTVLMKTTGAMKTLVMEFKNNAIRALIGDGNIETEYDHNGLYNQIPLILGIGDEGLLRVSRFVNGIPYNSEVMLANGDILTDLAYYLNKSDQVFSAILNDVWLNESNYLKVDRANSVIFQLLPNHTEKDIIWIENLIKNNNFKNMTLSNFIDVIGGKELSHNEVISKCNCNSEKMLNAIRLLSENDKNELLDSGKDIEIKCDFCLRVIKIDSKKIL